MEAASRQLAVQMDIEKNTVERQTIPKNCTISMKVLIVWENH